MARCFHHGRGIAMVMRGHDMQLLLCDELESLADSLPSGHHRCVLLARAMCPLIASTHQIEEELLFVPLSRLTDRVPEMPATLERLRLEHHADLCFAEELQDALLAFGRGEDVTTAEAVGYMLRGFFQSVRRHVAFEKEILVPLLALVRPVSRNAS